MFKIAGVHESLYTLKSLLSKNFHWLSGKLSSKVGSVDYIPSNCTVHSVDLEAETKMG